MPKRFWTYSRNEPARTILVTVTILTILSQVAALVLNFAILAVPNTLVVLVPCVYAAWAGITNNCKHMPIGAHMLFMIWLFSGVTRLLFAPDPTHLLWVPFVIVSMALAVVYIYLAHQKRLRYR